MKALVIGGAGYIGSVTAHLLKEEGHDVTIVDDLSTGKEQFIETLSLLKVNILKPGEILNVLKTEKPDVVLHFAAKIQVAESVAKPHLYFRNNTYGTMLLLDAMAQSGCKNIVFSSTAAVYGEPEQVPIAESDKKQPINPYGLSKYISEQIIESYQQTHDFNWTVFRYFNAAGSYKKSAMDYPVMTHLIPHATEVALGHNKELNLYGDNYSTRDGTCVRDFVHVIDIAKAHIIAAEMLHKEQKLNRTINLGSSKGYSVMEVIKAIEYASGKPVTYRLMPPRPGDPATLIADTHVAKELLGWIPELSLQDMVESHIRWRKSKQPYSIVEQSF